MSRVLPHPLESGCKQEYDVSMNKEAICQWNKGTFCELQVNNVVSHKLFQALRKSIGTQRCGGPL